MWREWWTETRLRIKALVNRRRLERDLDEELQFHLAQRAEKNRHLGFSAEEAEAAARRRFGNVSLLKENCREMWIFSWLETLWKDIRYATRTLAKSPGFAAVVICSLALGIGANTAVFSVMNAVLFHALPYQHPEELATVCIASGKSDLSRPKLVLTAMSDGFEQFLAAVRGGVSGYCLKKPRLKRSWKPSAGPPVEKPCARQPCAVLYFNMSATRRGVFPQFRQLGNSF